MRLNCLQTLTFKNAKMHWTPQVLILPSSLLRSTPCFSLTSADDRLISCSEGRQTSCTAQGIISVDRTRPLPQRNYGNRCLSSQQHPHIQDCLRDKDKVASPITKDYPVAEEIKVPFPAIRASL